MTDPQPGKRSRRPRIALDEFRAMMREAGVEEVVEAAVAAFLDEAPQRLRALLEAVREGNTDVAGKIGHAMKSAASAIRADGLSELAAAMEQAGREGSAEDARALASEIEAECRAVIAYLETALGR